MRLFPSILCTLLILFGFWAVSVFHSQQVIAAGENIPVAKITTNVTSSAALATINPTPNPAINSTLNPTSLDVSGITLNRATDAYASPRLNLLIARASTPFTSKILGGEVTECDLVAIGRIDGFNRGFLYLPEFNQFKSDVNGASRLSVGDITTLAKQDNNSLTFTCAVPGQGWRMALDSNLDGILNGDES